MSRHLKAGGNKPLGFRRKRIPGSGKCKGPVAGADLCGSKEREEPSGVEE